MGSTVYNLPIDTNTPGVCTKIVQEINLAALDSKEFNRVVNAAKSGVVTGNGWVAELVCEMAKRHNLAPPIIVQNRWRVRMIHPQINSALFGNLSDEIMKLSDVREQFKCANDNRNTKPSVSVRNPRGDNVTLVGWDKSIAPLTKELRTRTKKLPWFAENNKKLVALLNEKPTVTITTTV